MPLLSEVKNLMSSSLDKHMAQGSLKNKLNETRLLEGW